MATTLTLGLTFKELTLDILKQLQPFLQEVSPPRGPGPLSAKLAEEKTKSQI